MSSHVGEGEKQWPSTEVYKINGMACTDPELEWMINHWGYNGTAEEFDVHVKTIRNWAKRRKITKRRAA